MLVDNLPAWYPWGMSDPCPTCGQPKHAQPPARPQFEMTPDELALQVDMRGDHLAPEIVEIATRKFGDREGTALLTYILSRFGYFKTELHTPRDVWYRNAASWFLYFTGLSTVPSVVSAMVAAGVEQAQRNAMHAKSKRTGGVAQPRSG